LREIGGWREIKSREIGESREIGDLREIGDWREILMWILSTKAFVREKSGQGVELG